MDIVILINVCVSFIFFLLVHLIVFRYIQHREVFRWLVIVFLIGASLSQSIYLILILWLLPTVSPIALAISEAISLVLYALTTSIFVLAIFGIIEASLRIRMLAEITKTGKKGISYDELLIRYNRNMIVKKRLERFLQSGDIGFDGERYFIKHRVTPFSIPGYLFSLIWKLYRG